MKWPGLSLSNRAILLGGRISRTRMFELVWFVDQSRNSRVGYRSQKSDIGHENQALHPGVEFLPHRGGTFLLTSDVRLLTSSAAV
jgi:hypothetical protein